MAIALVSSAPVFPKYFFSQGLSLGGGKGSSPLAARCAAWLYSGFTAGFSSLPNLVPFRRKAKSMQGATGRSERFSRLHDQGIRSMGHTMRFRTACPTINEHSVSKRSLTSGLLLLSNCNINSLLNLVLLANPNYLSKEKICSSTAF